MVGLCSAGGDSLCQLETLTKDTGPIPALLYFVNYKYFK